MRLSGLGKVEPRAANDTKRAFLAILEEGLVGELLQVSPPHDRAQMKTNEGLAILPHDGPDCVQVRLGAAGFSECD
jgi:hypothetical protein